MRQQATGKRTGLRLYPFLRQIFEANEQDKKADGKIELAVRIEFVDCPHVLASIEDCDKSRIQLWRYRYNNGVMGGPPKVYSFKYVDGKAVSPYSDLPLTEQQINDFVIRQSKRNVNREKKRTGKSVRSRTG